MENHPSLSYHRGPPRGKLSICITKPCDTVDDLSLAYSPGVGHVCQAIGASASTVYDYTAKGNMVAVITNATSVLGLGNIGPAASLPVMEGKCMILKRFAGVDAYPLVIQETNARKFISIVSSLHHSFGGINLEDIAAPECFTIERTLQRRVPIPVFHDDQHGTAIIILAALKRSLCLVGKSLSNIKIVMNGSGAAALSTASLLLLSGVKKEQLFILDSQGLLSSTRSSTLPLYKRKWVQKSSLSSLEEVISGADVCIGLSRGNVINVSMVKRMAQDAIVFALANPIPEIMPKDAYHAGAAIVATGRSDFDNQINNALVFPGMFRALLDVRARMVTSSMKLAASDALVRLCEQDIPDEERAQLSGHGVQVSRKRGQLIVPFLFDTRVVPTVAAAVAHAAITSGVGDRSFYDKSTYTVSVKAKISSSL